MNKQTKEIIENIQENLNDPAVRETEKYLIDKSSNFTKLLSKKIAIQNQKVGSRYRGYFLNNINGDNWFLKVGVEPGLNAIFYNEIISERLAKIYNINVIESKVLKYSSDLDLYAIMSRDYREPYYDVISGKEIILNYLEYLNEVGYFKRKYNVNSYYELENYNFNSLPVIYQALNYFFYEQADNPINNYTPEKNSYLLSNIYDELKIRYVFSYLTMQRDFHLDNWEIAYSGKYTAKLYPMYDLELSFDQKKFMNSNYNASMKSHTDGLLTPDEDFLNFINTSEENYMIVKNFLNIVTPEIFLDVMSNRTKSDIIIPPHIIENAYESFSIQYQKITEMLVQNLNKIKH